MLVTAIAATASAFSVGPVSRAPRLRVTPQPQMGLASLTGYINTGLYAVLTLTAGNGLATKVPALIAGRGVQVGDIAVDGVLFCVGAVQLGKMAVRAF